ncbi:hypothetical protein [Flavobacterium sp. TBRC 19031]|uniref:hypothetical protein n=1 Tax=Flavobacterium mekongense TaxID=3379707 RepID=UPI00399A9906
MGRLYFLTICLFSFAGMTAQEKISKEEKERREKNIQAANPFKQFGYKGKVATLSKGKYLEVHDLDSIVTIGSVRFHVDKKKIVGLVEIDTAIFEYSRPIGDIASRWLSPDPLSEETPAWSPYTMCMDNPIRFNDPSGMIAQSVIDDMFSKSGSGETVWTNNNGTFEDGNGNSVAAGDNDDDVTVDSNGNVTSVVRKEGANRFFDQNGTQLFFNDPSNMDKHMMYGHFNKGDNIYRKIINLLDRIIAAGTISENVSESYKSGMDYVRLGFASWGDWDFPTLLQNEFNVSTDEMVKAGYNGGSRTYFRFGQHNTIYNIYDAGQFMWGRALGHSGFSLSSGLRGAGANERIFSLGTQGDSAADTNAITNGFYYQYFNQKVRGCDPE